MASELDVCQVDSASHHGDRLFDSLSRADQLLVRQTWLILNLTLALNSSVPLLRVFCALLLAAWLTSSAWSAVLSIKDPAAGPSAPAPEPPARTPTPSSQSQHTNSALVHTCLICTEEISSAVITLPCGHHYDVDCITDLFKSAVRDESSFPPQCCLIPIPLNSVKTHFSADFVSLYLAKEVEYRTMRRVYCANPICSQFLGTKDTHGMVPSVRLCTAAGCTTSTCGKCTAKVTTGQKHACKLDRGERHTLAVGRSMGWVRCPGCQELIERTHGCFHMTCRCRTQFCYVCRAHWKTCKCTAWTARFAAVRRQPMQAVLAVRRLFWSASSPSVESRPPCRHSTTSRGPVARRCEGCQQALLLGYRCRECRIVLCTDCKLKQTT